MAREVRSEKILTPDFTLTCSSAFLFWTVVNLLLPTMPVYALAVGGTEAHMGLVVFSYTVVVFVIRPFVGQWNERLGPSRLMRPGAAVMILTAAAYFFVRDPWSLMAVRAMQGVGMGLYSTSASTLIAFAAPPRRRGEALGIYSTSLSVTLAIGPALGMFVVNSLDFRTLFVITSILTALAAGMTFSVDRAGRYRPATPQAGKLVNEAAFLPSLMAFAAYFAYGGLTSYIPIYAVERGLANPGLFFTAYAGAAILVRTVGGRLSDVFGRTRVVIPASVCTCVAMWWLSMASDAWAVLVVGILYGTGTGMLYPTLMAQAVDRAAPQERGSAMATFLAILELGITSGAMTASLISERASISAIWAVAGSVGFLGLISYSFQSARESRSIATTETRRHGG
ncbi:MAG: MFS transporter [Chloroflexi bacterium]|nr:MFS transporter [Chloroflexota bacterium]